MVSRRKALKGLALASGGTLFFPVIGANKTKKTKNHPFTFCLNKSTISGQNVGFLKEFEIASKAGYNGFEVWIRDIQKYIAEGGNLKDLKKYIDDLGIRVENAIGFAQWIVDDEEKRKAGIEQLKQEMDMLAQIGCERMAAPPAGATNEPVLDLFKVASRYREILEIGNRIGVVPQLEIWGPSANLYHVSQAMFVATATNHPKARILPDVYHMFRGGSGFNSLKMISGSAIEIFHFNDYVAHIPREQQKDSDRVYPGDGAAPYTQIIKDLYNAGGAKVFSLELFNSEYWEKNALEVAKTGLQKMKNLVESSLNS